MSYDEIDIAKDELYEQIAQELYPEHKTQAVEEFTAERLCSFYSLYPSAMRPAINALQEAKALKENHHYSAAVVFFVSSIELLLKATLLKPVVYGLVHNEQLADIIVQHTLGQAGFDRYELLLANLFTSLAGLDVKEISRDGANQKLLDECKQLQKIRNQIIHKGEAGTKANAEQAHLVAVATYEKIVTPMLHSIGLVVGEKGVISRRYS